MIRLVLITISLILYERSYSQISIVKELINNKYVLVKMNFNGHSNTLQEYIKYGGNDGRKMSSYKMTGFVYDTINAEHKRLTKGFKYSKNDTLIFNDWDPQESMWPRAWISKFRFNKTDSILTFSDIKYTEKTDRTGAKWRTVRKFKVVSAVKNEIVLLDMDNIDVKRLFYLKRKEK